jgi:hypothetical protein
LQSPLYDGHLGGLQPDAKAEREPLEYRLFKKIRQPGESNATEQTLLNFKKILCANYPVVIDSVSGIVFATEWQRESV